MVFNVDFGVIHDTNINALIKQESLRFLIAMTWCRQNGDSDRLGT